MCVFFGTKCVKELPFCILQNYSPADVIAIGTKDLERKKIYIYIYIFPTPDSVTCMDTAQIGIAF